MESKSKSSLFYRRSGGSKIYDLKFLMIWIKKKNHDKISVLDLQKMPKENQEKSKTIFLYYFTKHLWSGMGLTLKSCPEEIKQQEDQRVTFSLQEVWASMSARWWTTFNDKSSIRLLSWKKKD
jgi:hypothetical protein